MPDKQPYTFKIYRRQVAYPKGTGPGKMFVWFEDTEYGLAETMGRASELAATIEDETRPVEKIVIERVA